MAEALRRQDLPPSGGYKAINYKSNPARSYFSGRAIIAGYLAMTAGAAYVFYLTEKRIHHHDVENRSANFAVLPLLLAERDREYLKQLRRNRDEERSLMANVEGWVVGTWYGEPIYKTNTGDILIHPKSQEYYIHAPYKAYATRANQAKMC